MIDRRKAIRIAIGATIGAAVALLPARNWVAAVPFGAVGFDIIDPAHWDAFGQGLDQWWHQGRGFRPGLVQRVATGLGGIAAAAAVGAAVALHLKPNIKLNIKPSAPAKGTLPRIGLAITWPIRQLLRLVIGLARLLERLLAGERPKVKVPRARVQLVWTDEDDLVEVPAPPPPPKPVEAKPAERPPALQLGAENTATAEIQPAEKKTGVTTGFSFDDDTPAGSPAGTTPADEADARVDEADIRARLSVYLTDRGWEVRSEVQVDANAGVFIPDRFDADSKATIPIVAMSPVEVVLVWPVALKGTSWAAKPWEPEREGIPEWTPVGGGAGAMACPVASLIRAYLRFVDHHRANFEALGGPTVSCYVLYADGAIVNFTDVEESWNNADVTVIDAEAEATLEALFGDPIEDKGGEPFDLLVQRIVNDSNRLAASRGRQAAAG